MRVCVRVRVPAYTCAHTHEDEYIIYLFLLQFADILQQKF